MAAPHLSQVIVHRKSQSLLQTQARALTKRKTVITHTLSKALAAQAQGKFDAETVPVETRAVGGDGTERAVVVRRDEGPREGTSLES